MFDLDPKPDFHEWLYENQSMVEHSIKLIEKGNYNIIGWKDKKYGTSTAVSDEQLQELLNNKKHKVDYIWHWKQGPNKKTYI